MNQKSVFVAIFLLLPSLLIASPKPSDSNNRETPQEIQRSMVAAFEAFKKLQPFMAQSSAFEDQQNSQRITQHLKTLLSEFHEVSAVSKNVKVPPGFSTTLRMLKDMLRDVEQSFRKGQKRWAFGRLKTASNHCITCHTSYKVKIEFFDPKSPEIQALDHYSRGEFFLATRQFDLAKKEYFAAALKPVQPPGSLQALRKWMIISTRVSQSPDEALKKLLSIEGHSALLPYENRAVKRWIESLKNWKGEESTQKDSLLQAESLLETALSTSELGLGIIDEISALRATALLHSVLEQHALDGEKRAKALYLLGVGYSKLPLYFINELPEFYLEQCIRELPNTRLAQQSFQLYKEIVTVGFTGSGEIHIPAEIQLKFKELHDIAYGIPHLDGKV